MAVVLGFERRRMGWLLKKFKVTPLHLQALEKVAEAAGKRQFEDYYSLANYLRDAPEFAKLLEGARHAASEKALRMNRQAREGRPAGGIDLEAEQQHRDLMLEVFKEQVAVAEVLKPLAAAGLVKQGEDINRVNLRAHMDAREAGKAAVVTLPWVLSHETLIGEIEKARAGLKK